MARDDIKKIVDDSKSLIDADCSAFADEIKAELQSFKKKALG